MSKADVLVDRAAARLQELADRAAAEGGLAARIAQPLADDAAFLRKLKPSLIAKRAKGEAPTGQPPGRGAVAPSGPPLDKLRSRSGEPGPNTFLVIGVALAAGILIAKVIDWRGHAR